MSAMFPTNGMALGRGPGGKGRLRGFFDRLNQTRKHSTTIKRIRTTSESRIGTLCWGTKEYRDSIMVEGRPSDVVSTVSIAKSAFRTRQTDFPVLGCLLEARCPAKSIPLWKLLTPDQSSAFYRVRPTRRKIALNFLPSLEHCN